MSRVVPDPARPGCSLVWCKACEKHLPDTDFYAKTVARSIYECRACCGRRVAANRRAKAGAALVGHEGAIRKKRTEPPLIPADRLIALLRGDPVTIGGQLVSLQPAAVTGAAGVLAS